MFSISPPSAPGLYICNPAFPSAEGIFLLLGGNISEGYQALRLQTLTFHISEKAGYGTTTRPLSVVTCTSSYLTIRCHISLLPAALIEHGSVLNQGFPPAPRSSRTPNHNVECQHSRKTGESERNVLSLPDSERAREVLRMGM